MYDPSMLSANENGSLLDFANDLFGTHIYKILEKMNCAFKGKRYLDFTDRVPQGRANVKEKYLTGFI